ncbi:cytochrome P450 [Armillaria novae-zelandiae]|uniref:Cytochrome P450 n=1 Tax=Armillaria novae-zelandiae TaxID=153914 RepID=A0AA39P219_9AGAR|nr:cytochrome P450 [Armillaria novae-zelandiae]
MLPSLILGSLLVLLFSNLPPGPSGGLFGCKAPQFQSWKTFYQWNRQYGPVVSFRLGTKRVIVLGTVKAATDLLVLRGNIYSGRPRSIVAHEILSGGMRGIGMSDGPQYRKWKTVWRSSRLMQWGLSNTAALNYQRLQAIESCLLVRDLLKDDNPLQYKNRLRRFAISIVCCVAYGRRIKTLDDDIVANNLKTAACTLSSFQSMFRTLRSCIPLLTTCFSVPGKFLVDSLPILLYLPKFLQWFRWEPEKRRAVDTEIYLSLLNGVKLQTQDGTAHPSMATRGLEKQQELGFTDVETAYALSAPWSAGTGTTTATIQVFLLAMLHYPADQKRMPDFKDFDALPYIQAVIKETMRWRCIVPVSVPHAAMSDDVYNGMFIPKGSTVYANIYAMTQDETAFPNAEEFIPERFLNTSDRKMINFMLPFGFGRRQCPGAYVAWQSIFISVVRMLWAFDIMPPVDEKGNKVLPSVDSFTSGLTTEPEHFKCYFEPRSSRAKDIIMQEADRAEIDALAWK